MIPCAELFELYCEILRSCDLWWHGMSCIHAKNKQNLTSDLHP